MRVMLGAVMDFKIGTHACPKKDKSSRPKNARLSILLKRSSIVGPQVNVGNMSDVERDWGRCLGFWPSNLRTHRNEPNYW